MIIYHDCITIALAPSSRAGGLEFRIHLLSTCTIGSQRAERRVSIQPHTIYLPISAPMVSIQELTTTQKSLTAPPKHASRQHSSFSIPRLILLMSYPLHQSPHPLIQQIIATQKEDCSHLVLSVPYLHCFHYFAGFLCPMLSLVACSSKSCSPCAYFPS